MARSPDPNRIRNLGMTLVVLVVVGLLAGLAFQRLDRCTHPSLRVAAAC